MKYLLKGLIGIKAKHKVVISELNYQIVQIAKAEGAETHANLLVGDAPRLCGSFTLYNYCKGFEHQLSHQYRELTLTHF